MGNNTSLDNSTNIAIAVDKNTASASITVDEATGNAYPPNTSFRFNNKAAGSGLAIAPPSNQTHSNTPLPVFSGQWTFE